MLTMECYLKSFYLGNQNIQPTTFTLKPKKPNQTVYINNG